MFLITFGHLITPAPVSRAATRPDIKNSASENFQNRPCGCAVLEKLLTPKIDRAITPKLRRRISCYPFQSITDIVQLRNLNVVSAQSSGQRLNEITASDAAYLETIVNSIRVCATYKPKFGQGTRDGLNLRQFQDLYKGDPFYNWLGLDNPMMYAAHKAAGGMTSVYRQIGIGCEKVFRQVLQERLGLSDTDVVWSYEIPTPSGKTRTLTLDSRVPLAGIKDQSIRARFQDWMQSSAYSLGVDAKVFSSLTGVVFEVRQGYKSKDSKRQNADIANASNAYIKSYLPCAAILSNQIDEDILLRYRAEKWSVITGVFGHNDPLTSTYDFMRDVVGYDLAGFFERNSETLRMEVDLVLRGLLLTDEE